MKVEIRTGDRSHQVELKASTEEVYTARLTGSEGKARELEVALVSRTPNRYTLAIGGRIHDLVVSSNGERTVVDWQNQTWEAEVLDQRRRLQRRTAGPERDGAAVLKAHMAGKVITVFKQLGDAVEPGEGLAIVEAMKMQNELKSPKGGTVTQCRLAPGETVDTGDVLYVIE